MAHKLRAKNTAFHKTGDTTKRILHQTLYNCKGRVDAIYHIGGATVPSVEELLLVGRQLACRWWLVSILAFEQHRLSLVAHDQITGLVDEIHLCPSSPQRLHNPLLVVIPPCCSTHIPSDTCIIYHLDIAPT